MTKNSLTRSDRTEYCLVKMTWGTTGQLLITDAGEDVYTALSSDPFVADPALEIEFPNHTGGSADSACKIRISKSIHPMAKAVSSGRAHADVAVSVYKFTVADADEPQTQSLNLHFKGTAVSARRNPNGARGLVELNFVSQKNYLNITTGMQGNAECSNTFGGYLCGINQAELGETVTVTSISRNLLSVTGLTPRALGYYRRGYVEREGVLIPIRTWDGISTFELSQYLPEDWNDFLTLGTLQVTLYPGCDLLYRTCRDVWSNQEHFNGLGYSTPAYNPIIENPEQ